MFTSHNCVARSLLLAFSAWAISVFASHAAAPDLSRVGVSRGIAVVLDSPDVALALARQTELTVHLQLTDRAALAPTCQRVDEAGYYGTRIYVAHNPTGRISLADNLADVVIDSREAAGIPPEQLADALRVLRPQGKALLGGSERTKPFPSGVDDWSHPYHGPDNNPLSQDQVARAPYLTQFLADPRYAPLPQVAVASAGRVFKAFGHIAFKEREEPWLNTLAAFNGYNGTLLWRREIASAIMVHRNTLIATPTELLFGDDRSCKVFDAATGDLRREIAPPAEVAGGTFWKWMALQDGVLYALLGEQERRDPVIRTRSQSHGWPWDPLSPGYNQKEQPWGYGRTLLAIELKTGKVLWRHQEERDIDSRALCLHHNRIFAFRPEDYLTCVDAKTGTDLWRKTRTTDPALFSDLGPSLPRQDWRTNWRTTAYLKASGRALYFAGPTMSKLLAVAAEDGRVLWQHPYDNYQIIVTDTAVYGVGGQIDKDPARVFDPWTGRVLQEVPFGRRACTRVTGSVDALFCRANGGSQRFDLDRKSADLVSPMRPNCHDGVTIANGLLYWWPSVCDCNLTLYGITCLGPAGDFAFDQPAVEAERLERFSTGDAPRATPSDSASAQDWPTFRANNRGTVTTDVAVPAQVAQRWQSTQRTPPTAPTAAGDLVFVAGADGIVRALDAQAGTVRWKAYTGGDVRYPPTVSDGKALVGSGDGSVYAFDALTGKLQWRFRAAPADRRIPVYGGLQSTWPVGSGVLVEQGTAIAAAGIVNYDGTHVYALDAATGRLRWQNNTSGHLDAEAHSGVSVQGHMVTANGKVYLAGGNAVSPAIYDLRDGKCLNDPVQLRRTVNNSVLGSFNPRGSELYTFEKTVMVAGKPLYAHPQYEVYDDQVMRKTLFTVAGGRAVAWVNNEKLMVYDAAEPNLLAKVLAAWGKPRVADAKPVWESLCRDSLALAVGANAVVVARKSEVLALALDDGRALWTEPLPAKPVRWGLCLTRHGQVIVALENGTVLSLGSKTM